MSDSQGNNLSPEITISGEQRIRTIYYNNVQNLYTYGIGLGFSKEEVKDSIQDVFYKLLCKQDELDKIQNITFYLMKMLKNHLLNAHRNSAILEKIDNLAQQVSINVTVLDKIISEEERVALESQIKKLLLPLTDRQREAIRLRFLEELDYEQIAILLDMSVPSVRNLVARAVSRMRKEDLLILIFLLKISPLTQKIIQFL